jgi:hypothetical protein
MAAECCPGRLCARPTAPPRLVLQPSDKPLVGGAPAVRVRVMEDGRTTHNWMWGSSKGRVKVIGRFSQFWGALMRQKSNIPCGDARENQCWAKGTNGKQDCDGPRGEPFLYSSGKSHTSRGICLGAGSHTPVCQTVSDPPASDTAQDFCRPSAVNTRRDPAQACSNLSGTSGELMFWGPPKKWFSLAPI